MNRPQHFEINERPIRCFNYAVAFINILYMCYISQNSYSARWLSGLTVFFIRITLFYLFNSKIRNGNYICHANCDYSVA